MAKRERSNRGSTVHPRTCGEHCISSGNNSSSFGSSPHVRGTYPSHCKKAISSRFIPARAGNIEEFERVRADNTVHPRTCGEHVTYKVQTVLYCGSSPHVRGTLVAPQENALPWRFIPARAGNIHQDIPGLSASTVHPRTCGEHLGAIDQRICPNGSSPHVRGTYGKLRWQWWGNRFIPARAGNMRGWGCCCCTTSVHPRTCGEHRATVSEYRKNLGSSPHVRGTCGESHAGRRM